MPRLSIASASLRRHIARSNEGKTVLAGTVTDDQGRTYGVLVGAGKRGESVLRKRSRAERLIPSTKQTAALDFALETSLQTGKTTDTTGQSLFLVLTNSLIGEPLPLSRLGDREAGTLGSSIAAIHLMSPSYLIKTGARAVTGLAMRVQIEKWITSLNMQNVIPQSILSRWNQLVDIENLWTFRSTLTHGDFETGDALFAPGTGLTGIANWEDWQIGDPARDFAWLYSPDVDAHERDTVLTAYGHAMGSREDSRIVPRARMWRQMATVRAFLSALDSADHDRIVAARKDLDDLASSLRPVIAVSENNPAHMGQTSVGTSTRAAHESAPTQAVAMDGRSGKTQLAGTPGNEAKETQTAGQWTDGQRNPQDGQAQRMESAANPSASPANASAGATNGTSSDTSSTGTSPSTITVGTLLDSRTANDEIRNEFNGSRAGVHAQESTHPLPPAPAPGAATPPATASDSGYIENSDDETQTTLPASGTRSTDTETTAFDAAGFAQGISRSVPALIHLPRTSSVREKANGSGNRTDQDTGAKAGDDGPQAHAPTA